jgi:S-adenosylmethionine:diacylglycerol 3-amino-3-carboxypropyl transferase
MGSGLNGVLEGGQLLAYLAADQSHHQSILIGKILIEAADADTRPLRDNIGIKARQTIARHNLSSGFNNRLIGRFRTALVRLFTGGKGDSLAHARGIPKCEYEYEQLLILCRLAQVWSPLI